MEHSNPIELNPGLSSITASFIMKHNRITPYLWVWLLNQSNLIKLIKHNEFDLVWLSLVIEQRWLDWPLSFTALSHLQNIELLVHLHLNIVFLIAFYQAVQKNKCVCRDTPLSVELQPNYKHHQHLHFEVTWTTVLNLFKKREREASFYKSRIWKSK